MLKKWVSSLLLSTTLTTTVLLAPFVYQKWHIMGGKNVENNKYPWFATIRDIQEPVNSIPIGGGVLIAPEWVLTAAHLFKSSWFEKFEPHLKVTFNQNNLDNSENLTTIYAQKVICPPDVSKGNDLSLIKLNKPVENIIPIKITEKEQNFNQQAITMGFGKTDYHPDSIPTILQEVSLPVINPEKNLPYLNSIGYQYNKYDVIAGTTGGIEKFPTPGDGGGPLVQLINNQLTLIGIFKSGIINQDIMQDQYPTLFTSVFKNKDWIIQNIQRDHESINQKLAIQKYFLQAFDYDQHRFTTKTTRKDVRNFVESEVKKIFNKPFILKIINDKGTVIDNSEIVEDGDWFDFELKSLWFNTKFRYVAKNVGNKTTIRKKIQQIVKKFAEEIDVTEHELSINSFRADAYRFVNMEVKKFLNVKYHLVMKGSNFDKKVVNDAANYVWKGDWFDFNLIVPSYGNCEFRFRAKNVSGVNDAINFSNRIVGYFLQPLPFNQHLLITSKTYYDAQKVICQVIKKMKYYNNFSLSMHIEYYHSEKLSNTNEEIGHGEELTFHIKADDFQYDFNVQFKNIGADYNQGMFWDMIDYWNTHFKSIEHFNTQNDQLELADWIQHQLKDKFNKIEFRVIMINLDDQKPLKIGATYYFNLGTHQYQQKLSLNINKLERKTSIVHNLKMFFNQEFLFHEHQLTTKNSRGDAQKLALSWIKKITNEDIDFILDNFDAKSNIVNDSSLVSHGDWFDFKIKINRKELEFRFKIKNVQGRPGSGYLWDLSEIFSSLKIDSSWYKTIRSNLNYRKIREKVLEIIVDIFVSLNATFSLSIEHDNIEELIGKGDKMFNFKIIIDNVPQFFSVYFLNIPE